ncbi:cytochrome b subunit of succinate dehydrogenase, Sdh3p [Lithohypha guttulata]|uniref:cytochrome b subunit of succinate dehydrogenase, Sdh3p n=1 Tax=Lithohypha guttulata TaxID=1690604 RepID=UPI00315DBD04
MFSQRAVQTSMRRLATIRPTNSSTRMLSPAAIATGQIRTAEEPYQDREQEHALTLLPLRLAATSPTSTSLPVSSEEANKLLASQRKNRPVSPHLGIYRPQVTWIPSAMNRVTGSILSGGLYIFGFAYLVAPAFGWHLESATMAATVAAWPVAAKVATKFLIAWPFTFHSFNGLRHLTWDLGAVLTNKQVIVTGWTVIALSFVTALGLTFY